MFPYTLFYVDDDLKAQKAFLDVFSGYIKSIVCFTDGNKALEAVKNSSFDIFVTAVSIPHVDGLILAKEVKKLYPWLPVIIFSSFENFEIATEAIDIGVEGYISKSVSKEQFIKKMLRIVKKLTLLKNSKHNEILLNQYKEAIDRSSIVSKTDLNGRITYVNEAFCKISGYTQEELLGKSHNIVRHPDMPSSAFQAMWQSIQAKKPWDGVIKNRKKTGMLTMYKAIFTLF